MPADPPTNPYEPPTPELEPAAMRWGPRTFEIIAGVLTLGLILAGVALAVRVFSD